MKSVLRATLCQFVLEVTNLHFMHIYVLKFSKSLSYKINGKLYEIYNDFK